MYFWFIHIAWLYPIYSWVTGTHIKMCWLSLGTNDFPLPNQLNGRPHAKGLSLGPPTAEFMLSADGQDLLRSVDDPLRQSSSSSPLTAQKNLLPSFAKLYILAQNGNLPLASHSQSMTNMQKLQWQVMFTHTDTYTDTNTYTETSTDNAVYIYTYISQIILYHIMWYFIIFHYFTVYHITLLYLILHSNICIYIYIIYTYLYKYIYIYICIYYVCT